MPVIPEINKAFKIGLNFTPNAPPEVVAAAKAGGEAAMSSLGLIPAGPIMIPVMATGAAITFTLEKIEAMLFSSNEKSAQISGKLMKLYYEQLSKAQSQRLAAENKLFEDEKTAKQEWVDKYESILVDIEDNNKKIDELNKEYTQQLAEYMATIAPFAESAKKAKEAGDEKEEKKWVDEVAKHDPWYEEIQLLMVDMVQLQLDNMLLKMEADRIEPITKIEVRKEWVYMEGIASLLEVVVPFYPDLPTKPNLPVTTPVILEDCWPKALRKAFSKWMCAPMIPPIGLAVAATLDMVKCFIPQVPPMLAATMESQADSIKMPLGGII